MRTGGGSACGVCAHTQLLRANKGGKRFTLHIGDAHFRAGSEHGDNMFGNGGFIVHFFSREKVKQYSYMERCL